MACDAKLSADLFDVFQRYKRATGRVIKWLALASETVGHEGQSWSLDDLKQAAEVVKQKAIEVPESVYYAFQDAIGCRSDISLHFRQNGNEDEEKTLSHEFFTKTLKSIFEVLCPPRSWRKPSTPLPSPSVKATSMPTNHYHILSSIETEAKVDRRVSKDSQVKATSNTDKPATKKQDDQVASLSDIPEDKFSFKDDHIGIVFNMYYLLEEMDIVMSKVKSFWEQAASGTMSLIFAAWLTNAAFGHIQRNFDEGAWTHVLEVADNTELCALFNYLREHVDDLNLMTLPERTSYKTHCIFTSGHGMMTPGRTLFAFKTSQELGIDLSQSTRVDMKKPSILEKPADHITIQKGVRDGPRQVDSERAALLLMLNSIDRLNDCDDRTRSLTVEDMNPLYEEVGRLSADESIKVQTDIAFGLQLLVETYKSFLFAGGAPPTKVNCRLQALRFAGEVKRSVSRVQSLRPPQISKTCTCPNCHERKLEKGMRLLEHDLTAFSAEKRFDLYYQAPWVAGTQMLEILSQATDFGLLLCNRFQYVGTVLHLYNCLRQVGAMDKETVILERLCNLMEQAIFQGRRPDRNFYTHFLVLLGGRLEFDRKKMHRKKQIQPYDYLEGGDTPFHGRDRTWRMALPEFVNRNQLTIMSQSHFYALNAARFGFSHRYAGDAWTRFYGTKKGYRKCEEKELTEAVIKMYDGSFVETLSRMKRDIGPELEGQFPIARINWMEVYLTCTEILEKIAIAKLQEPASPYVDGKGESYVAYGSRFTETFLDFADEHASPGRDRKMFPMLAEQSIRYVRDAIDAVFKGKKTADYVWQIS